MKTVQPLYLPAPYQDAAHEGRMILRDGSTASLRVTTPDDREALAEFYRRLSPQSRRFRFFTEAKPGIEFIDGFCDSSNPKKQMTLVAMRLLDGVSRIIATGSYVAVNETTAEFAVAVGDDFHGKGLGGLLFERLAVLAASSGFVDFVAITDPANHAMLDVFRHSGFEVREQMSDGCVRLDISMKPRRQSVAHSETRDRVYTTASIRPFFKPNAVAVVGASRDPASIGYRIFDQLLKSHFAGPIYPVNPNAGVVRSMRAFKSVRDIPEPVDLAVIVVPKEAVLDVVDDCAVRGVRALVVITAGFAEQDAEGAALQRQLVEKVRGYGMRMVGPNCLGLINADPDVCLNASLSSAFPQFGGIAMSSQSGALGFAVLERVGHLHLGLSTFVSMGNKADVTGNDLLQYWEDDPATRVILLYLESFGNPRRFARIARRVGRSKPIVCVKSGRITSRTGGPASDTAVTALFEQSGVIRADTLEEMLDLSATLSNQPLPRGRRIGIVTNAGGPAVLCADACAAGGLEIPPLNPETIGALKGFVRTASPANPLYLNSSATTSQMQMAVERVMLDDRVDAVIVIFIPVGPADASAYTRAIADGVAAGRAAGAKEKPVMAVMMTEDGANAPIQIGRETLPRYLFPESAARVIAKIAAYAAWRRQAGGAVVPSFEDTRPQQAREICRHAIVQRGGGWLSEDESRAVLDAFRLPASGQGGIELRCGVTEDPVFGPLISFGLGGPHFEALADVVFRITPLTEQDARDMIAGIRGSSILRSPSGTTPADTEALADMLLRLSLMVEEIPEIREIDLNPVFALEPGQGCRIGAVRIRVEPVTSGQPMRYTTAAR